MPQTLSNNNNQNQSNININMPKNIHHQIINQPLDYQYSAAIMAGQVSAR
jgi:hypothetical protein